MAQLEPGLLDEIAASAADLHSAGALSPVALRAIVRHLAGVDLRHSLETGSGATTLLLSRLSPDAYRFRAGRRQRQHHAGQVIAALRSFHHEIYLKVRPRSRCQNTPSAIALQAAILDGPHAFPFPALEYYYLYPRLSTGALLVVDDIQIPSVHDFFRFLKADEMFEWIETVQRTAFFRRTSAEVFNPTADDWWLQGYNKIPLRRFIWRDHLRGAIPERLRRTVKFSAQGIHGWALSASAGTRLYVRVDSPKNREIVDDFATVRGAAVVPPGTRLWLLARRKDVEGWWPQGGSAVHIENDQWQHPCTFGTAIDAGSLFEIAALAVNQRTHSMLERWVTEGARTGSYAPLRFPDSVLKPALRIVQRRA